MKIQNYFTKGELLLWSGSTALIVISFIIFGGSSLLTLAASLIGTASLIFNAKGNPTGPILMVFFSLLYGIISYSFAYYGEMITYLGMTMPMSIFAFVSWIKNPYKGNKAEVEISRLSGKEIIFMSVAAVIVTAVFYFVLKYFKTANIIPSTISVTTSFAAVYLTYKRSPHYAAGYAANDVVLIVMWILAAAENKEYISVVICFAVFFANDMYGFYNWKRMEKRQANKQ